MFDGVGDQVGEDVGDLLPLDGNERERVLGNHGDEADAIAVGDVLAGGDGAVDEIAGGARLDHHVGGAGLEPGKVEQIVNHQQKALGVVTGGEEKLGLLGVQHADALLEE